jgi:hypothetical protein
MMRRTPQTIVANLVNSGWQHMLQKTPDELGSADGHGLGLGWAVATRPKGHLTLVDRQETAVGDGHPVNVAAQVLQDSAGTLDRRFTVNDPVLLPETVGQVNLGKSLANPVQEETAKQPRQGLDRDQIVLSGRPPGLSIRRQPSAGRQAVHMRMVREIGPPSMQNRHYTDAPSDIPGIGRQLEQRLGGGFHEQAIEDLLLPAHTAPELLRYRKDDMIIRNRQEVFLSRLEPGLGVTGMAFGTTAVPAGVVRILQPSTVITRKDMAS